MLTRPRSSRLPRGSGPALAILVSTSADARAAGVPFAVITRRRAMLRPAAALGLERVLPVHGGLAEALECPALH